MNRLLALSTLTIAAILPSPAVAASRVDMVVVTDPGFSAAKTREWYESLVAAGASNLQIRTAKSDDKIEVEPLGNDAGYRVVARLTTDNELVVPGRKFTSRNRSDIGQWLTTLRDEGPARAGGAPKAAFGLSVEQAATVRKDLGREVAESTKGRPPRDVVHALADKLSLPIVADPAIADQLGRADPVRDELKGLATGTALAAISRPEGLVLVPRLDAARQVQYVVTSGRGEREVWPVGVPVEKASAELVPGLFETLNIEVAQIPIEDVLKALGERLKIPILFDHNALARHATDLRKKVSLPRARTAYAVALRKLLTQAELKYELRVDDAGRPLLWITSTLPEQDSP